MPPKAPTANTWLGAPPVAEDGFAFAEGLFFAQASGQNRHRRATTTELKEHFTSGNDKDHPAHWFEAQLIHYGLQPSKTKSVARMRLFDAVNAGNLKVPANVSKLEAKLKKEWTKNNREAKKSTKPDAKTPVAKAETKATTGTKRKANDDDSAVAVKKAKTATPKAVAPKASAPKTATTKAKAPSKAPAKTNAKTTTKPTAKVPTETNTEQTARKPRTKQMARCSRGGISQGPGRNAPTASASASEPARPPRTKQTARRSGAFAARGRIPVPSSGDFDDAPPPYSEFPDQDDYSDEEGHGYASYDNDEDNDYDNLTPLGLLNGDYEIVSSDVTEQWDFYDPDDFNLTLTLAGNKLWGRFNLGVYEGVLCFDERPMRSSHERLTFKWRGREDQGPVFYGNSNTGWMEFLGNGRINGCLDCQSLSFRARRFEGQGTRSSIDAGTLQDEWNGYSYQLYEEENRARW